MAPVRYIPLLAPHREVENLRPAYEALRRWRLRYPPSGPEYLTISAAVHALDGVAEALTGEPLEPRLGAHSTPKGA